MPAHSSSRHPRSPKHLPKKKKSRFSRVLRRCRLLAIVSLMVLASLWAVGAISIDGPMATTNRNLGLAIVWFVLTSAVTIFPETTRKKRFLLWLSALALVVIPWSLIEPSNDREWKPDWRETGWAEINGDAVTLHNFRNFDYTQRGGVLQNWETRTVHLSKIQGLDYFHDAFGGDLMAHPLLSFDFGEDGHVVLSVETRREVGESYSEIGGLYKMFELQYLFGDEKDLIRVRTNIRGEPVHLYRSKFGKEVVTQMFLESVNTLNALKERPRWYNVVTANCTTSLRAQTPAERRARFDYRLLVNGRLDELLYERDVLHRGSESLDFDTLRQRSLINAAAQAAHDASDFSRRIREDRPGFE